MTAMHSVVDGTDRGAQIDFGNFLWSENNRDTNLSYQEEIKKMITQKKLRLKVNILDLINNRTYKHLHRALLFDSLRNVINFEVALKEVVASIDQKYARDNEQFFIGLYGHFGSRCVNPDQILSSYTNQTICLEGVVISTPSKSAILVKAAYFDTSTTKTQVTRLVEPRLQECLPTFKPINEDGIPLEFEPGLSTYQDCQKIILQTSAQCKQTAAVPQTIEVWLYSDLVDVCKPGDDVSIVGSLRLVCHQFGNLINGFLNRILIANNVIIKQHELGITLDKKVIGAIRKLSKKKDIFQILANSIAPSIMGLENVKAGLLCVLLGGREIRSNMLTTRGQINMLLVGEPSVGKSQLLRFVQIVGEKCLQTSGRGASGVGMTAAITSNPETKAPMISAGPMVLADRGIVCIDEFDKMSESDRTSIHEVMEQGSVSISKAGFNIKLNARCSIIAAANPVRSYYDESLPPQSNIPIIPSLMSRFDLIFIVKDEIDRSVDDMIADHVLHVHRDSRVTNRRDIEPLDQEKLKQYIYVARRCSPSLTEEAREIIVQRYVSLRQMELQPGLHSMMPVTPRTCEGLVRLATAHAKARLSKRVEEIDANFAANIVRLECFRHIQENPDTQQEDQSQAGSQTNEVI